MDHVPAAHSRRRSKLNKRPKREKHNGSERSDDRQPPLCQTGAAGREVHHDSYVGSDAKTSQAATSGVKKSRAETWSLLRDTRVHDVRDRFVGPSCADGI
jgi:hypothetical protein